MSKNMNKVLKILLILGMLISLFLVYEHFSPNASKFCDFGEGLDCGIVNKSPYANLDGISYLFTIDFGWPIPLIDISGINWFFNLLTSNAFLGFLTLVFLFFLVNAHEGKKNFLFIKKKDSLAWMKGITLFGVVYGFYLFLIQHYILKTYCVYCLALDVVLISSLIIVWRMKK
ncbi:MAG: vitamin K epoxide reductase family protein [Nanoarchaeota archaeon]